MANGFRPDTNRPGHHITVVQGLSLTIRLDARRVTVLDTLRRKRHLADYTGDDIDDTTAEHCIEAAEQLLKDVKAWLKLNRPELMRSEERRVGKEC